MRFTISYVTRGWADICALDVFFPSAHQSTVGGGPLENTDQGKR